MVKASLLLVCGILMSQTAPAQLIFDGYTWKSEGAGDGQMAYDAPRNRLAAIGPGPNVKFFDATTGQYQSSGYLGLYGINNGAISISGDGTRLAVGKSTAVQIFSLPGMSLLASYPGGTPFLSPTGTYLAILPDGGPIVFYGLSGGSKSFAATNKTVAFSPDESRAYFSSSGSIRSLSLPSGSDAGSFGTTIQSLSISGDGQRLAASGLNGLVRIYNPITKAQVGNYVGLTGSVYQVAISSNAQMVAGANESKIIVWRVSDGAILATLNQPGGVPWTLLFSQDNTRLFVRHSYTGIRGYRTNDWQPTFVSGEDQGRTASLSADANIIANGGQGGTVTVRRADNTLQAKWTNQGTRETTGVALMPDGAFVITGDDAGFIEKRDAATGAVLQRVSTGQEYIWSVTMNPSGTEVIVGEGSLQGIGYSTIRSVQDLSTVLMTIPNTAISWARYSPDGQMIFALGLDSFVADRPVKAIRRSDGSVAWSHLPSDSRNSQVGILCEDGTRFGVWAPDYLNVYDSSNGAVLFHRGYVSNGGASILTMSRDGRRMVFAYSKNYADVTKWTRWDVDADLPIGATALADESGSSIGSSLDDQIYITTWPSLRAMPNPLSTWFWPRAWDLVRGFVHQGSLEGVARPEDGKTLELLNGLVPLVNSDPLITTFDARMAWGTPATLKVVARLRQSSNTALVQMRLWNWTTSNWDVSDKIVVPVNSANWAQVELVATGDLSRYVRSDGMTRVELRKLLGPVQSSQVTILKVDQLNVMPTY